MGRAFIAFDTVAHKHTGARDGIVGIDDGGGLIAIVREARRFNRLDQIGIFLFADERPAMCWTTRTFPASCELFQFYS